MPIDAILESSRAGLAYERLRLETASRNIAAANVPLAANTAPTQMVPGTNFETAIAESGNSSEAPVATREVYDPSHPLANSTGMVRYPNTDLVQEMTTLLTASRSYEANVRAFNMLRGMTLQALEIGAK